MALKAYIVCGLSRAGQLLLTSLHQEEDTRSIGLWVDRDGCGGFVAQFGGRDHGERKRQTLGLPLLRKQQGGVDV